MLPCVRARCWLIIGLLAATGCEAPGPRLELVTPRLLRRDAVGRLQVIAEERPGVWGAGAVTFQSDRGSLEQPVTIHLDDTGQATITMRCPSAEASCGASAVTISALWRRASDTDIIATATVPLGEPAPDAGVAGPTDAGVDPTNPRWMDFSSGFFLDGQPGSYVLSRRVFEPAGSIIANVPPTEPGTVLFRLSGRVTPGTEDDRPVWNLEFAAPRGERLRLGVYRDAERAAFRTGSAPGLAFSGEGRACNRVGGSFEVHELDQAADGGLSVFTATFEHWCESSPNGATRGWVRFR